MTYLLPSQDTFTNNFQHYTRLYTYMQMTHFISLLTQRGVRSDFTKHTPLTPTPPPTPRFPRPRLPALSTFPDIAGDTVAITFVSYAVSVSLAMIYADKHGYSIHPNQVTTSSRGGSPPLRLLKKTPLKKLSLAPRSCWLTASPTRCPPSSTASPARPPWPPRTYWRAPEVTRR